MGKCLHKELQRRGPNGVPSMEVRGGKRTVSLETTSHLLENLLTQNTAFRVDRNWLLQWLPAFRLMHSFPTWV